MGVFIICYSIILVLPAKINTYQNKGEIKFLHQLVPILQPNGRLPFSIDGQLGYIGP